MSSNVRFPLLGHPIHGSFVSYRGLIGRSTILLSSAGEEWPVEVKSDRVTSDSAPRIYIGAVRWKNSERLGFHVSVSDFANWLGIVSGEDLQLILPTEGIRAFIDRHKEDRLLKEQKICVPA